MASNWIEHVKKVASSKKITYKEAMKVAGATYTKMEKPKKTTKAKKEKQEKQEKEEPPKKEEDLKA
tara:strand:- start:310 stop:507 length:198 start_codon:yes stop_codon:yes gene_type:complete